MKKIVVDASVAIKWFIPEIHAIPATRLLGMPLKLLAPDLIFSETCSILWKKWRLKELTLESATAILEDFKRMPLDISEGEPLLETAWQIATTYQHSFYDSLYLALAITESCPMVTADRVFYNNMSASSMAKSLIWIEHI